MCMVRSRKKDTTCCCMQNT
uniref:Uncharacterized protein n=1 Tax=Arundo donax TaxID=35708 RepID=A0A0A8YJP3_ARUDO